MKAHRILPALLVILPLISIAPFGSAQNYSLEWFTVDGGGGTSTNLQYVLTSAIGQHDAGGSMTGGSFSVTGGFLAIYAVQTTGAPRLAIRLTATNTAQVYWPSTSTGWTLQMSTNPAPADWASSGETVQDNGTIKFIIVNPPMGNRFYRLKTP